MTGMAAGCAILLAFVVWIPVFLIRSWQFYARPENQVYTNYNTPKYIVNWLVVSSIQNILVIVAFLIPFVILVILVTKFVRDGDYDD